MPSRIVWAALITLVSLASPALAQREPWGPGGLRNGPGTRGLELRPGLPAGAIVINPAEPLPADAQALVTVFEGESAAIRQKAEQEIQEKRHILIATLQGLQDSYTRDAKLDEAVAIRDVLRQLRHSLLKPLPDPGNLGQYVKRIGESFYFDVVGQTSGSVWGSEVYTYDSSLATAAVHAGVLKPGQRGIVKVTMVPSLESHMGSTQHGVTSANWGSYAASYTVERADRDRLPTLKSKAVTP